MPSMAFLMLRSWWSKERGPRETVTGGDAAQLAPMAADLVARKVDLIEAVSPAAVRAAHAATAAIPIVANDLESDPVASGFAASVARPGANITGVFLDFPRFQQEMAGSAEGSRPANRTRCGVLGSGDGADATSGRRKRSISSSRFCKCRHARTSKRRFSPPCKRVKRC